MFTIVKSLFLWKLRSRSLPGSGSNVPDEHTALLAHGTTHDSPSNEANNGIAELPSENSHQNALVVDQRRGAVELEASRMQHGEEEEPEAPHIRQSTRESPITSNSQLAENDRGVVHLLEVSDSSRDFLWKCSKYFRQGGRQRVGVIATVIIVLFAIFVGWSAVGVLSANIASDKTGLSSSTHCGIWQFDNNADDEAGYRDDLYNRQKEERASQYARNCYNNPDPVDTLSCRIFHNQSIGFETKTQQRCPFSSAELCIGGPYSAVSFDTGLVDASVIGINSQVTYKFRRRTSCSPLEMSEPYITRHTQNETDTNYYYNYGSTDDASYTYNTSGCPFDWPVPVYSASAEFSSLYPDRDYWHPIAKVQRPENSTLTIIFVSSLHIYHISPSYDPIFPADQRHPVNGSRSVYYFNSDPIARPVACVDTSEVCSADGKKCFAMRDVPPPEMFSDASFWLMKWSLESSNIYDSIGWRLGAALLAQEKVSQSISTPLAPNQWEIEMSQLFETSLARIQYDAWGIATGEDRERPGYVEVTPDEARGQLCGLYKFKTADYTNVNLAAFLGYILLSIAIYLLSSTISWKGHKKDKS